MINANDINIYRQLAGGVTVAQLLHGSANPIGGQSAIKLRWGQTADKLKYKKAKPFIKFALGENVKQSNWGSKYKLDFKPEWGLSKYLLMHLAERENMNTIVKITRS